MRSLTYKIEVMKLYNEGHEVEAQMVNAGGTATMWEDDTAPTWNWVCVDYRIKTISLESSFIYLAELCENNKDCIVGEAKGSPAYWGSIEHWINQGREAIRMGKRND